MSETGATAKCPVCGIVNNVNPVRVIYAESEEEALLFQNRLNVVECESCNTPFQLNETLLYTDEDFSFAIFCLIVDDEENLYNAEEDFNEAARIFFDNLGDDIEMPELMRFTLNRKSFIEKVAMYIRQVDDRIIEFIKYNLFKKPEAPVDAKNSELLYDFTSDSNEMITFLICDRENGKAENNIQVPKSVYDGIMEMSREEDTKIPLGKYFPTAYVNVERLLNL